MDYSDFPSFKDASDIENCIFCQVYSKSCSPLEKGEEVERAVEENLMPHGTQLNFSYLI